MCLLSIPFPPFADEKRLSPLISFLPRRSLSFGPSNAKMRRHLQQSTAGSVRFLHAGGLRASAASSSLFSHPRHVVSLQSSAQLPSSVQHRRNYKAPISDIKKGWVIEHLGTPALGQLPLQILAIDCEACRQAVGSDGNLAITQDCPKESAHQRTCFSLH